MIFMVKKLLFSLEITANLTWQVDLIGWLRYFHHILERGRREGRERERGLCKMAYKQIAEVIIHSNDDKRCNWFCSSVSQMHLWSLSWDVCVSVPKISLAFPKFFWPWNSLDTSSEIKPPILFELCSTQDSLTQRPPFYNGKHFWLGFLFVFCFPQCFSHISTKDVNPWTWLEFQWQI